MLSFLHFPCVLTLSHKSRKLTYMAYSKNEIHSRFISFYRKYCEGSGGEYQLIISPTDIKSQSYTFTLRLPERSPGAAMMTSRELFGLLRRQFAIQYAPIEPALPVQLAADSWEDLL